MNLKELLQEIGRHQGKTIFVYFTGSKDGKGDSWCPDCNVAAPVVRECAKALSGDHVLIEWQVGERSVWKDRNNEFRTDQRCRLTAIPTLLKWGTEQRLVEEQCTQKHLVEMMFEN